MRIIFRTHGGKKVGLGHLSRCLALAEALRKDAEIVFMVNDEVVEYVKNKGFHVKIGNSFNEEDIHEIEKLKPLLVIVDSYETPSEYINMLRKFSKVAIFDDNGEHNPIVSHYVINGNIHADEINYKTRYSDTELLLGPKYLVMNPDYWSIDEESIPEGEGILITTGGADIHELMPKFMEVLKHFPAPKRVIIGPFYSEDEIEHIKHLEEDFELIYSPDSLKNFIEESKLVITAAGSTVYEVLTLKKIPIIYTVAYNQFLIEKKLKKLGVISLGYYGTIKWDMLLEIVKMKYYESTVKNSNLMSIFDGKGVFRVKRRLLEKG